MKYSCVYSQTHGLCWKTRKLNDIKWLLYKLCILIFYLVLDKSILKVLWLPIFLPSGAIYQGWIEAYKTLHQHYPFVWHKTVVSGDVLKLPEYLLRDRSKIWQSYFCSAVQREAMEYALQNLRNQRMRQIPEAIAWGRGFDVTLHEAGESAPSYRGCRPEHHFLEEIVQLHDHTYGMCTHGVMV